MIPAHALRTLARRALSGSILGGATLAASCNPMTTRPAFRPFPEAVEDTISATLSQTVRALSSALLAQGLPVRMANEQDGFVETRAFDVRTGSPSGPNPYHPERVVVLRFWADSTPRGRTRVLAEAAHRNTADPSIPRRLAEVMAAPGHAGRQLLDRILDAVKQRFDVR